MFNCSIRFKAYSGGLWLHILDNKISWLSLLDINQGLEEHPYGLKKRWLGPVVNSMLFANLLEFWCKSWVMIMRNSWEEMMLDLIVQSKWNVECNPTSKSKVHLVLTLASSPTLEILGLWSPLFNHALDMANLRESNENSSDTKHVSKVESDSGQTELVREVSSLESMTKHANHGIWWDLRVTFNFANISTVDSLMLKKLECIDWSNNEWRIDERNWNKHSHDGCPGCSRNV